MIAECKGELHYFAARVNDLENDPVNTAKLIQVRHENIIKLKTETLAGYSIENLEFIFVKAAEHLPGTLNNIFEKEKWHLHMDLVRSWDDFIPGQIVEFRYYWIWHQGILTEANPSQKTITVIHYGAKHLFATRTIVEEKFEINPSKQDIYISRPDPQYTYTPDEVIRNAKERLGEQKWRSGNRSYDFCRQCVFRKRNN
ncbi:hypothetical protein CHS0354_041005 [Potamilus streckersoni]|uniref:Uncharacterized protein n=1 Tax=Potamilus streckersoni TaxID=2493646 RepID=A0AAE0SW16_9BIVA|nr:hypothetical protein CHS0354_041005 [Potamilus streckersoni]